MQEVNENQQELDRELEEQQAMEESLEQKEGVDQNAQEEQKDDKSDVETELNKYKDMAFRARADYENFKRRVERQREETKNFLIRDMAKGILESLDNLERAILSTGNPQTMEEKGEKFDSVLEGINLVVEQINTVLKGYGVEQTGEKGEIFDPRFHEAIQMTDDDSVTGQQLGDIYQKGYKIDDFSLRLARVQVIRGRKENEENNSKPQEANPAEGNEESSSQIED